MNVVEKIIITKEEFTEALLESEKFPGEKEDLEMIDSIWKVLFESLKRG